MTTVVCIGKDEYSFTFCNLREWKDMVFGRGVIKGLDMSVSCATQITGLELDCKVVLDRDANIAYMTCAKGERSNEKMVDIAVTMNTLREASEKDGHMPLEWEALKMIEGALCQIHRREWKLVVCDPRLFKHRGAVQKALRMERMEKADDPVEERRVLAEESERAREAFCKGKIYDQQVVDKFGEVPVRLAIPGL